jgi:opacity protein-like surface antigen
MKRIWVAIAVLTLVVAMAGSSRAQMSFAVGPRIGFNMGSCSLDPDVGAGVTKGGRFGIIFGSTVELGFKKMFYVVLEPLYIQKGFKIEGQGGSETYKFSYFSLPLYFKVKFLQGMVRPYAFLGPDLGIMLSATQTTELTGRPATDSDWSVAVGSDFSLDFGGGAEIAVASNISVMGDVRYMLGLVSVYSNPNQPNQSIKTGGFVIMFGALFQI